MLLIRLTLAALSAGLLSIAWGEIASTVRYANIASIATKVEKGVAVEPSVIETYAKETKRLSLEGVCRSDLLKAGATTILAELDGQSPLQDYDNWYRVTKDAERYFQGAIDCSPTNGNFWLRLAMVRRAIAEAPSEQVFFLSKSLLYAPAEDEIIRARLLFYTRLETATFVAVRPLMLTDLKLYMRYSNPRASMELARLLQQRFAPEFAGQVAELTPAQLRGWERAGLKIKQGMR